MTYQNQKLNNVDRQEVRQKKLNFEFCIVILTFAFCILIFDFYTMLVDILLLVRLIVANRPGQDYVRLLLHG